MARAASNGSSGRAMRAARGATPSSGIPVPAAARTMALFEIFARERRELTKSEVARLLDLPESSSSDLLNTLRDLGYVSRTVTTRRFYPTGRLLAIANTIGEQGLFTAFGVEATSLLAQRSGETAVCAVIDSARIKVVAVSEGRHRLRYVIDIGDTFTIHATAIGKALLGVLEDDDMARTLRLQALSPRTPYTKVDPREVEEQVRAQRELGWYGAVDEGTVGVSSLAVSGRVGGHAVGLGIIGPSERIAAEMDELRVGLLDVHASVFGDG
ncbi:IclR family transcriptional regulator [Nocardia sp. R16R-3T]